MQTTFWVDPIRSSPIAHHELVPYKSAQYMAADHHPQDLRCAFADRQQTLVAVDPLDRKFLAVAVAAKNLNCVTAGLFAHLRGEQLGHRGLFAIRTPLVPQPRRMVEHMP